MTDTEKLNELIIIVGEFLEAEGCKESSSEYPHHYFHFMERVRSLEEDGLDAGIDRGCVNL